MIRYIIHWHRGAVDRILALELGIPSKTLSSAMNVSRHDIAASISGEVPLTLENAQFTRSFNC